MSESLTDRSELILVFFNFIFIFEAFEKERTDELNLFPESFPAFARARDVIILWLFAARNR